jgi:hypothetical protein
VHATTGEVPLVRLETEVSRMPNEEPRNSTASRDVSPTKTKGRLKPGFPFLTFQFQLVQVHRRAFLCKVYPVLVICGQEAEAEFASALLGLRCWLSSVTREAISLLSVARSLLNAADALTPSGPAGAPAVVWDA